MSNITVATHNGIFHADDVFSIAALRQVLPAFDLVRSRDSDILEKADVVVDVGGVYDACADRFDHHQRGGAGARKNGIPYSSFGLIWKKYGVQICAGDEKVANAVDSGLVSAIDAIDCGFVEGVAEGVSLSQTIGMFNPTWDEQGDFDQCFDEAVDFASHLLGRFIVSATGGVKAKAIVAQAIAEAADPRVIVLKSFSPWKKTVHALADEALYVVYPSQTGQWRVQCVPVEPGSFENKKSLPAPWGGLADNALQQLSGVDDAMFCHNGLFIAGAESFAGAMKMARLALEA